MTCINREGDVPPEGHSHLPGNASMGRGGGGGERSACVFWAGDSQQTHSANSL